MGPTVAVAAVALALGGPAPALLVLAAAGVAHAARSPDRLVDLGYATLFCGIGALVG